jgi:hypothetical protein
MSGATLERSPMEEPQKGQIHYLPLPRNSLANPFRAGTKKAQCFEIFARGGARDALIAQMEQTGAAGNTVRTWLAIFRAYARGVREGRKGESK